MNNLSFQPKKRQRTKSTNSISEKVTWSVKRFRDKTELENFISSNNYKYRSKQENTELQTCRFCQALNPNIDKHMIQVYLMCLKCKESGITKSCCKTNICKKLNKYELLTNHKDISENEWIIFEEGKSNIDDYLAKNLLNMTISNKIKINYYEQGSFYVWVVKDVLPYQTYLFEELYIIKMENQWIEFYNGVERSTFTQIVEIPDGFILRREDDFVFKLDSKKLYNCDKKEIFYEGEWIKDKNKQIPCITCSEKIDKMVFECDHLPHDTNTNSIDEYRVWKAKNQYCLKYFKRKNVSTWEEYCNDELTNEFDFIEFDQNNDLIIRRKSVENPDFLRFTDREVFIGSIKHFVYGPLYTGYWENENDFKRNILKSSSNQINDSDSLNLSDIAGADLSEFEFDLIA